MVGVKVKVLAFHGLCIGWGGSSSCRGLGFWFSRMKVSEQMQSCFPTHGPFAAAGDDGAS